MIYTQCYGNAFINFFKRLKAKIYPFCYKMIKKPFFYIRWWLIGRYFCDMPKWSKKYWVCYTANKLLWGFLAFSTIYTLYKLSGGVG